jgi:hypothetical protein
MGWAFTTPGWAFTAPEFSPLQSEPSRFRGGGGPQLQDKYELSQPQDEPTSTKVSVCGSSVILHVYGEPSWLWNEPP